MPLVCTIGAVMTCFHGGAITLTDKGNDKFTITTGGSPKEVLTELSIIDAPVILCPYNPGSPSPCTVIDNATGSEILTVDDDGVILFDSAITTLNTDTNSYDVIIISSGQVKLTSL